MADIEKLFLAHFFEDDSKISVPTLLTAKQKKGEPIKTFVDRFQSMALHCPSSFTQSTLVETCHHNLQTFLLTQMGVAKYRTWKQLVLQGKQAEEIVARVRAEEKHSKLDPTSQSDMSQSYLLNQEEGILWRQKSNHLRRP